MPASVKGVPDVFFIIIIPPSSCLILRNPVDVTSALTLLTFAPFISVDIVAIVVPLVVTLTTSVNVVVPF